MRRTSPVASAVSTRNRAFLLSPPSASALLCSAALAFPLGPFCWRFLGGTRPFFLAHKQSSAHVQAPTHRNTRRQNRRHAQELADEGACMRRALACDLWPACAGLELLECSRNSEPTLTSAPNLGAFRMHSPSGMETDTRIQCIQLVSCALQGCCPFLPRPPRPPLRCRPGVCHTRIAPPPESSRRRVVLSRSH